MIHYVCTFSGKIKKSTSIINLQPTGGPGVGKSSVLKVIDLGLEEIYGRNEGQWKCHHVKVAFTGAACNVLGRGTGTIHSTFAVPINQNEIKCQHHVN